MLFKATLVREKAPENLAIQVAMTPEVGDPIGNFGISDIETYLKQVIIGYGREAHPLLVRGNQRIDMALATGEVFRPVVEQHWHYLHQSRALGNWMENSELADDHWNQSRRFFEAWWRWPERPWTRQEIIRDGLDDFMALAVLGGDAENYKYGTEPFAAGIDMFKHWNGKSEVSFKKTLKPREFGYALCRHYLNHEFDRADILLAGRRMLAANLESEWLSDGQTERAAMWLMIVYWYPAFHNGEELPTPVDVLLKAYDDMPNVTRPF